jgi:hypothetical protein
VDEEADIADELADTAPSLAFPPLVVRIAGDLLCAQCPAAGTVGCRHTREVA